MTVFQAKPVILVTKHQTQNISWNNMWTFILLRKEKLMDQMMCMRKWVNGKAEKETKKACD